MVCGFYHGKLDAMKSYFQEIYGKQTQKIIKREIFQYNLINLVLIP